MNGIVNYLLFKEEMEKYEKLNNSFNDEDKMSVFLSKYDELYRQFKKIKSMQKGKFTTIKQTDEQVVDEITSQLRKIYFKKMCLALSHEDYKVSEGCVRGLIYDFQTYKSKYFNGIVQSFITDMERVLENIQNVHSDYIKQSRAFINDCDPLYNEIAEFAIKNEIVSAVILQRKYNIGFNRASYIIDMLEKNGIIGPANGSNPRKVLESIVEIKIKKQSSYFSQLYGNENQMGKDINNKKDLLDIIDKDMNGYDFEIFTKKILLSNNFVDVSVTQSSGDFGVDVIAYKEGVKYAIQCKKYSSKVGIKAVQEVVASKAMNDCHVAVIITNNEFTDSAITLAKKNNVLLWDRSILKKLLINYKDNNDDKYI